MTGKERFDNLGSKEYLLQALKEDKPHIKVLALIALLKGLKFETYEQLQFYIKRNLRPASNLTAFDLRRIAEVYKYCEKQFGNKFKIGLETIEKYILEDIDAFVDKEAIITLKDGEKVYETKRLKELESKGRIKYKGTNWIEV